jgi:hypothetical protein
VSIDLSLGVLADVTAAERAESPLFYEHVERLLSAVDEALHARGLPAHREPRTLPVPPPSWTLSSGLYPFRDVAWAEEEATRLRFPHVLSCAHEHFGVFVPILFDEVLALRGLDLGGPCGSSYRLYDECRALAARLGILEDIDADPPHPVDDAIARALGTTGLPIVPRPGAPNQPWPEGADGCHKLHAAARRSIELGIAIVIH